MPDSLNKPPSSPKTVAILGAGPVGLAAAAHVLERGMEPIVLEAGPQVGHAVRQWSHVPLFSPWEYAIDKASERLLTAAGWNSPAPDQYPTGGELLAQYLEPLATRTPLKDHIRTSSLVTSAGRVGREPGAGGVDHRVGIELLRALAVLVADGEGLERAAVALHLVEAGAADAGHQAAGADVVLERRARGQRLKILA